ncbi:zinc transporter ZntB [Roseovarius sp. Pro17]|uniref:zinc transporter ZntB n=1 Tax=Roseovarius sp. Pro17 TaxID=3108175 RepID=UPI002D7953BE|nr:zinc transporter ZntB [Roseovarius sp. Pro17]
MHEMTAILLDGQGGARRIAPEAAGGQDVPEGAILWVHVRQSSGEDGAWLTALGGDDIIAGALMAEETRPRCTLYQGGVLMNLRGVNLNPGEDPEDMISLRIWAGPRRIVTLTRRPVQAVQDLLQHCEDGTGPAATSEVIAQLALRLADRTEPVVADLNERIDDLEDAVEAGAGAPPRRELAEIRRVSIQLRRYMFPQRDALSTLEIEPLPWVGPAQRSALREATERVTRLAEELDAIRDRAQVVHDHIMDARAEAMNRQMLLLSVVTAVFLPLGLITGLLGINVGGMPGANAPHAFWIVCAVLLGLGALLLGLFSRLGWLARR